MTRVLVTGAAGVVGQYLVRSLMANPALEPVALPGPEISRIDLTDASALRGALELARPDVVVNAAGRLSGDAGQLRRDNTLIVESLIRATAVATPQVHLILLGSAAEYGEGVAGHRFSESDMCHPQDAYGRSKLTATELALSPSWGVTVTVLRVFNLLHDSGTQVLSSFLHRAREAMREGAGRVAMGSLAATRDFITMGELGTAVAAAIAARPAGLINICSGEPRLVRDVIEDAMRFLDLPLRVDERLDGSPSWSVGDPGRCRRLLGFAPIGDVAAALATYRGAEAGVW